MASQMATIRTEIDPKIDLDLKDWAKKQEGRSKRRHASILLERATRLWKQGPIVLGQMDRDSLLRELDLIR